LEKTIKQDSSGARIGDEIGEEPDYEAALEAFGSSL